MRGCPQQQRGRTHTPGNCSTITTVSLVNGDPGVNRLKSTTILRTTSTHHAWFHVSTQALHQCTYHMLLYVPLLNCENMSDQACAPCASKLLTKARAHDCTVPLAVTNAYSELLYTASVVSITTRFVLVA
jgi:hypothetical protein